MAGADRSAHPGGNLDALFQEFNKLIDDMEALRAAVVAIATRLDGDAGVTATVFTATDCAAINPATDLTAGKLK
jgi:hypothetical protein